MTYIDALNYIDSICGLGAKLGLARVYELMRRLLNPQENLKVIHVAGTNGKGSCCAMLSSILIDAGYKVGVYTSPHLIDYNERYTINKEKISDENFAKHVEKIIEISDELEKTEFGRPTVFELLTAVAFCYFDEQKVDYLILEVGLGGRLDATNVITSPILSIITSIGMDHIDYLGDDILKIATEKAGIIKENSPCVLYNQDEKIVDVIKGICENKNAKLYYAYDEKISVIRQDLECSELSIANEYFCYECISLKMLGDYQIKNCALVLLCTEALKDCGVQLTKENILNGIKNAVWMGRMEICHNNPLVIIDGAHNLDGITMLESSLKKYFPDKKITLLISKYTHK